MGLLSDKNYTVTPLDAAAVYTGAWELTSQNDLMFMFVADQGASIAAQFSNDSVTVHSTLTYTHIADIPSVHRLVKGARYVRFVVTNNSGSNMTLTVLSVSLGAFGPLTSPLNLSIGLDADAVVTRVVPTAVDVALGRFRGYAAIDKWGHNGNLDTGTEDIWQAGGTMVWPTVAAVVSVTSGSGADNGATATGAITLTIEGLDASWAEISETITLNGTSAVTTIATFLRVNRAYVASVGTYHGANTGALTGTISGSTMFSILAGDGQTEIGRYSVPAGKTLMVDAVDVLIGATKSATVNWWRYPNANDVSDPFGGGKRLLRKWVTIVGAVRETFDTPLAIAEYTDVWFEGTATANDTKVTARLNGILATN